MRKKCYISGAISQGDLADNIEQAENAYFALLEAGFAPFCPHWSVYSTGPVRAPGFVYAYASVEGRKGVTHATWLEADLPWVAASDVLLRLPGKSAGADMEVALALARGIPVFDSVEAVIEWSKQ